MRFVIKIKYLYLIWSIKNRILLNGHQGVEISDYLRPSPNGCLAKLIGYLVFVKNKKNEQSEYTEY